MPEIFIFHIHLRVNNKEDGLVEKAPQTTKGGPKFKIVYFSSVKNIANNRHKIASRVRTFTRTSNALRLTLKNEIKLDLVSF